MAEVGSNSHGYSYGHSISSIISIEWLICAIIPESFCEGFFPKNFYQIQLSTSSTKHLLHLSYIHFICINFIYITYITYIINTINRNLTSTYLLQNSHNVIYKEFLHRTCYTGVLTQKLFTGVALHIFCKGVATEELLHRSSLPGDLITCIWTPTSLLLLTFYILSLMAAGASSSSPTSSLSSDAHPHPHPYIYMYIYIGKLE
jgi:hypothetical protein